MTVIIPVATPTTREVLYGSRRTTFRYELLEHDPATGLDSLIGYLDGVQPGGSLRWTSNAAVKKRGDITVADLATSTKIRFSDIDVNKTRIRPVMVIDGLPEFPLSLYVISKNKSRWQATGRVFEVGLLDKSTVLAEDLIAETFTASDTDPILEIVQTVVESAGETIAVDGAEVRTLPSPRVWPVGTSKLRIVNDLLDALNYNSLWVDGVGAFRATPYVAPASRSIRYTVLNDESGERLLRKLTDGAESIYSPDWTRDYDTYEVPNRVVAVQAASGDAEPLTGEATNTNPDSPFSYPSRGRWIVHPITGVDVPDYSAEVDPDAATEAFLDAVALRSLIAASAVQATVSVSCLPIPLELLDAVQFANTPADIDARHTTQGVTIPLSYDGLMSLDLQEVIDL